MRRVIALSACLAIAGCAPPIAELSDADAVRLIEGMAVVCEAQGVTRYTDEMESCLRAAVEREYARRESGAMFGAAMAAGMTSYGNSVPAYRAPVRCYSTPLGGTINTTCY